MEPTCGEMDQVTAVLAEPVTVVENCCAGEDGVRVTLAGATETVTGGTRVTVAVAVLVESAVLVAVMVTVCWEARLAGTV